jgi:sigma-B regulation protein RsbU (phosphoserine phosphatase)
LKRPLLYFGLSALVYLDSQTRAQFLTDVIYLIGGTIFVVIGLVALIVAAIRRRASGWRAVLWLGIWSAAYGSQRLNACSFLVALLPHWLQVGVVYSHGLATYFVLVAGLLTFRELTLGKLRQIVALLAGCAMAIAILGFGNFVFTGEEYALIRWNTLIAVVTLAILVVFFSIPRLNRLYGVVHDRGVLLAGSIIFGAEGLLTNFVRPFGYRFNSIWDDLGFLALLLSLAYVAMRQVYTSERRLSSIENELAIARQLQFSILPTTAPEIRNLGVAAVYEPMTAVAGDFYEYLPVDHFRTGLLVADVSGHGVPAALIASMIKVAAQSITAYADNPSQLLHRLGQILSDLRGQFVSAAYLWIDTKNHVARYSAAGHPPLFFWCAGCDSMNRIDSNGPLFGSPCDPDFPTREIPFTSGDRFLLYTDGLSEPENATGEAFGDHQIEEVLRENKSRPASELSLLLLNAVRAWPPAFTAQQDDITFLLIDVL